MTSSSIRGGFADVAMIVWFKKKKNIRDECALLFILCKKRDKGKNIFVCGSFQLVCCNDWRADKQAISEKKINATDWTALEEKIKVLIFLF